MPPRIERGLYEALVTDQLESALKDLGEQLIAERDPLRAAEAADRIALHVGRVVNRVVAHVDEKSRIELGLGLARRIIREIHAAVEDSDALRDMPASAGDVLRAVLTRQPDGSPDAIASPLIPLLDSALLTNSPGEPRVGSALQAEIASTDRIDLLVAFIRYSGIRPFLDSLERHCKAGRSLRVLTTIYTQSTEQRALDALKSIGAAIRVSYDTTSTRLHAKAWLFHRASGFSTSYIGSSNLTHSAQREGLEWNLRLSGARNEIIIRKMEAVFDSYWMSPDFVAYDAAEFRQRIGEAKRDGISLLLSPIELRPEPFQERLLEQIEVSRQLGYHKNLLVSATGTGKTVMAAIDYARLRERLPRSRLLFVAHREEILERSRATFRQCLRDATFGELWVRGLRPAHFEHVFASIQSLSVNPTENLPADYYDVIIVDEFHHAAADSYQALLNHVRPRELLGMTATPERSDGLPILHWFNDRIAAELRLWDAIEQQRLSPFAYFGIHDGLDLREIPWRRGRGYDAEGLTNLLTADDIWARRVISQVEKHVVDVSAMRALGFCVSVRHALFMERVFNAAGIPSVTVSAETPSQVRALALRQLSSREVNVVFSVDLFNEGIDIPAVDTLLFLRPTDSPTLFLQQLGRGLRRERSKLVCTVLDFVGHHRREFRFDRRFCALLGGTRVELERQIRGGFPFLPAGCHMELDRVAAEIVLDSIKRSVPTGWTARVQELRLLAANDKDATLSTYLIQTGLELEDIYAGKRSWSDLRRAAGLSALPAGPHEHILLRGCGRLLHVDDRVRIDCWRHMLTAHMPPRVDDLSQTERRLLRMLVGVCSGALEKNDGLQSAAALLWQHPQVRSEILELLDVLRPRVDHVHTDAVPGTDIPLQVHARYTRSEILSGVGIGIAARPPEWREGVRWANDERTDLLAFTLDKSVGHFSPTTRYRDYAISRELIHWESQSMTRADGETGQRYQRHAERGTRVMLFARLRNDDRAFWCLGLADYVKHESEAPMAITWRLRTPLSGDLFSQFAAAVA